MTAVPAEDCDSVEFLRARLERRLASREKARGEEAEELDLEIAQLEETIAELLLGRTLSKH